MTETREQQERVKGEEFIALSVHCLKYTPALGRGL